jgi:hypothetical protein
MSRNAPDKRYHQTKEVVYLVWRVPRERAGHVQFILEAHDNLCVCSTLPPDPALPGTRDMLTYAPIEWEAELRRVWAGIGERIPVLKIEDRIRTDD